MRKSPLALLLSLICLISSHNEIQAQGHPPTDSLRQRAAASVGKEKHDLLMRIAMSTNDIADWDATLNALSTGATPRHLPIKAESHTMPSLISTPWIRLSSRHERAFPFYI